MRRDAAGAQGRCATRTRCCRAAGHIHRTSSRDDQLSVTERLSSTTSKCSALCKDYRRGTKHQSDPPDLGEALGTAHAGAPQKLRAAARSCRSGRVPDARCRGSYQGEQEACRLCPSSGKVVAAETEVVQKCPTNQTNSGRQTQPDREAAIDQTTETNEHDGERQEERDTQIRARFNERSGEPISRGNSSATRTGGVSAWWTLLQLWRVRPRWIFPRLLGLTRTSSDTWPADRRPWDVHPRANCSNDTNL